MRTDIAEPVRLKDYRVPDYLIGKVDLDVKLHPAAARVKARLSIRPNPQGRRNAPLILDGDGLAGLVPRRPGPRRAHKLTAEIVGTGGIFYVATDGVRLQILEAATSVAVSSRSAG